jgi:hypothetical protein
VWGDALIASPQGPTYEAVRRHLPPLFFAGAPGQRRLTASGAHYVVFGIPRGARGADGVELHVADGGEIVRDRIGGRALTVLVGPRGRERYGSCLARLGTPTLADGWLPILRTRYADSAGVRYAEESFAWRVRGRLTAMVALTVDARGSPVDVRVRFVARGTTSFAGFRRTLRTVYVTWSGNAVQPVDSGAYNAAREQLADWWTRRLSSGASMSVPERRVVDAERNLLVQDLTETWRYSVGNQYEEFSYPESVDVAQVMTEWDFADAARTILETSFGRPAAPYPNWRKGEKLVGSALYFQLSGDRRYVERRTPLLSRWVLGFARQLSETRNGLLRPERYSSDIPEVVYGLHSQAVVWEGLTAMADVWAATGHAALAARATEVARRLKGALMSAVRRSERRLADGSLFVPVRLLGDERAYGSVTESRSGSYWNLVMPYALASGLFAPNGREARGIWRYMELHGSRLLGLVRAGAYALYGRGAPFPVSGTDNVYGINVARFLANEHRADQLVLSMYGALGAAMTPGTFVAGEAASVAPRGPGLFRSMYLPPNAASNAAFLVTLRLLLVHETVSASGHPNGIELAFATPRRWLQPGRTITVANVPTSFGLLSYSLTANAGAIDATIDVPPRPPQRLALRLRLPRGRRIANVSLNGNAYPRVNRSTETIDLSGTSGHLELEVAVSTA